MTTYKTDKAARRQLSKCVDLTGLSKNEARVEIAKDVLAAVQLGRLFPESTYGYMANLQHQGHTGLAELRDLLAEYPDASLSACLAGSMLLAVVARDDNWKVSCDYPHVVMPGDMAARLAPFFDAVELGSMETYFEGHSSNRWPIPNVAEWSSAGRVASRDGAVRLIKFCEVLIANEGVFPTPRQLSGLVAREP